MRYDYLTAPENSLQYPAIDLNNPFAPINTVVRVKNDTNNIAPRFDSRNPHMSISATVRRLPRRNRRPRRHRLHQYRYERRAVFAERSYRPAYLHYWSRLGQCHHSARHHIPNAQSYVFCAECGKQPGESPYLAVELGLERQPPSQVKLTINYVGNHGEKLYANQQFNYS
jgi:hypothetical protein